MLFVIRTSRTTSNETIINWDQDRAYSHRLPPRLRSHRNSNLCRSRNMARRMKAHRYRSKYLLMPPRDSLSTCLFRVAAQKRERCLTTNHHFMARSSDCMGMRNQGAGHRRQGSIQKLPAGQYIPRSSTCSISATTDPPVNYQHKQRCRIKPRPNV